MKLSFPLPSKPQARPRFNSRQKRAYEDKGMTNYKQTIGYYAMAARPELIDKGAVMVEVCFYIQAPQYLLKSKKKRQLVEREVLYCDKKPDIDNYFKAVTDAVNGIMYKDDGQIAVMICRKVYSLNPRTELEITKLEESE